MKQLQPEKTADVTAIRSEPKGDGTNQTLLSIGTSGYWIIGEGPEVEAIKVGDKVVYQPYGMNFGWFLRKAT